MISSLGHWLLSDEMRRLLQTKRIPFIIRGVDVDPKLSMYQTKTARSVPDAQWDSPPREGEVIVCMVKGSRIMQISIDPKYLVPWNPKEGGEVVVIAGDSVLFGCSGIIVDKKGDGQFIVQFTTEGDSLKRDFPSSHLAVLEALRV